MESRQDLTADGSTHLIGNATDPIGTQAAAAAPDTTFEHGTLTPLATERRSPRRKGTCAVLSDVTSVALHSALSGLSLRQRAISDNIANIQTPGFLAGRVSFEGALADAVADGDLSDFKPTVARSLEPTREDGNNVNLDHETLSNMDTNLRYSAMLRALEDKFGLLSTVIKGGAV